MSIFFPHIICLQGDNKVFLPSRNISKRVAWSNSGKQNNNGIDIVKKLHKCILLALCYYTYYWALNILRPEEYFIHTLYMNTHDYYGAMKRHTYNILSTVNIKETYMAGIFLITALTGTRAFLPSANQSSPFFISRIWGPFSPEEPLYRKGPKQKIFSRGARGMAGNMTFFISHWYLKMLIIIKCKSAENGIELFVLVHILEIAFWIR